MSAEPLGAFDEGRLASLTGVKWNAFPPDVLPAWIADMDFDLAPPVRAALAAQVAAGDLGYPPGPGTPLRAAFAERMAARYGWRVDPAAVRETTDVIQGLEIALTHGSAPGDPIAIHTPTYPPFLATLQSMGRPLVPIPFADTAGGWRFDPEAAEAAIARAGARALVLVSPHNPTGRVFSRAELGALAEIAARHDLLVVADEVHAELTHEGRHVPFASLDADTAGRTITLTSATKAFNLAGIRCAVSHFGDARVLAGRDQVPSHLYGQPGVLGVVATLAAWNEGEPWLEAVRMQLRANRDRLVTRLAAELPAARLHAPEATYLAWIDFRGCGLGDDPAAALLERARVALSPGPDFGTGGHGFARFNFATGPRRLDEAIDRIVAAVGATSGGR